MPQRSSIFSCRDKLVHYINKLNNFGEEVLIGFTEALKVNLFWRKRNANYDERQSIVNLSQSLLSPIFSILKLKKGGKIIDILSSPYGRFLIKSTSITSTMMTNTNRPAIAGTKYRSAVDSGCAVGSAVASGWSSM